MGKAKDKRLGKAENIKTKGQDIYGIRRRTKQRPPKKRRTGRQLTYAITGCLTIHPYLSHSENDCLHRVNWISVDHHSVGEEHLPRESILMNNFRLLDYYRFSGFAIALRYSCGIGPLVPTRIILDIFFGN
jgi:hypothetical protein